MFWLFHLSFSFSFPLGHALVESNATHITIASFVAQHVLEGDFGVVAPLSLFSFKRLVSQDKEVEQASICEEHGISNKSSQEVDTCYPYITRVSHMLQLVT